MIQDKWDKKNIIDQSDKIAVVTGGNSGIGLETAMVLAGKNATVVIAVRDRVKGESASGKIKKTFPKADIRIMELDLADLTSVKAFSDNFKQEFSRLDLLINNAGVMAPPYGKTVNGFELQMGTNHLGHFALTGRLIDLINTTPKSRIVNVSSMAHKTGKINFDDLNWDKRKYKKWSAYGDSKIANLYFTFALQKRLEKKESHAIVTAAHPGWTSTNLSRHSGLFSALGPVFAQTIPMGALPTLYAATGEDVRGGDFFGPSGFMEIKGHPKKVPANKRSRDLQIAEKLWRVSKELTGITY